MKTLPRSKATLRAALMGLSCMKCSGAGHTRWSGDPDREKCNACAGFGTTPIPWTELFEHYRWSVDIGGE